VPSHLETFKKLKWELDALLDFERYLEGRGSWDTVADINKRMGAALDAKALG